MKKTIIRRSAVNIPNELADVMTHPLLQQIYANRGVKSKYDLSVA